METMNYFQHDYRSRLDKKLLKIRKKHGMLGFGVYWALVEMLHEGNGFIEMDTETIAYELQCDEQIVKDVIEICFDYFEDNVTCNRVIENLEFRREKASAKSKTNSENAKKRWDNYRNTIQSNTNSIPSVCESHANDIRNHAIEKEKEKEKDIDIERGIDKRKLAAVYAADDKEEIENTEVDYFVDTSEIEYSYQMLDRVIQKFVDVDSRFKFNAVMREIDEDYAGFDNLLEMYLPGDTSAHNNYRKQLNQYKNGIYA
jgi:hypothetical protein